jgi:hypothetical protein
MDVSVVWSSYLYARPDHTPAAACMLALPAQPGGNVPQYDCNASTAPHAVHRCPPTTQLLRVYLQTVQLPFGNCLASADHVQLRPHDRDTP